MTLKTKSYIISLSLLCMVVFGGSCRKDFNYQESTGNLSFSKDTVYLDTVFTNISSSTYGLKVYNESNIDISIPTITLENGIDSKYRINVDGQSGSIFTNTPLFANDSLYIFIETTVDISESTINEILYTDAIVFDNGENEQKVPLVTLVKDAIFLYPKENTIIKNTNEEEIITNGFILYDELHFTNEKSYVIYGYAIIPENETLQIDAGARVYFHEASGIYVQKNSSLIINGAISNDNETLENEVIFQGDRLEPEFSDDPGQWGSVWLSKESSNNQITNLTIKNATIGLYIEGDNSETTTNLTIHNTQIYNSATYNMWCNASTITATNVVMGYSGNSSLIIVNGGNYSFEHCTIANYWTSTFRSGTALQINNNTLLNSINFTNCIIDGNSTNEISLIDNSNITNFNYNFKNCLLKTTIDTTENSSKYITVYINEDASFKNTNKNSFNILETSFAIGKGSTTSISQDILGNSRSSNPDIGAYQYILE